MMCSSSVTLREICHAHKRVISETSRNQLNGNANAEPTHFTVAFPAGFLLLQSLQTFEPNTKIKTKESLHGRVQMFRTYKMSEIGHHPSILTLNHVQGLCDSPQDIKAPIPTSATHLVRRSNVNDDIIPGTRQREQNSPFNLWHFPAFEDVNREEIKCQKQHI